MNFCSVLQQVNKVLPSLGVCMESLDLAALALRSSDALLLGKADEVVFVGPHVEDGVEDTTGSWTETDLDDALAVTRTDSTHNAGFRGDGMRIAVMEPGQSDVPLSCFDVAARQVTTGSDNDHLTNSMLMWGNTDNNYNGFCHGSEVGYAPDARILMANYGTVPWINYAERYARAKNNDVDVVSMSFHEDTEEEEPDLHSQDIYFDYWATQSPWPSVFTSAGNEAATDAYASGKGFNITGVGCSVLDSTLTDRCDGDVFNQNSGLLRIWAVRVVSL